ncbi:hypothetical protein LPJ75_004604 [Coemansia sp. RSA 2598]|nr:hypothetical protein LPJ75_004604 [Coemansia sp. RSA 2598]
MFGVFFPRIGDFISWCGGSFVAFAGWWSDTGGPLAAEYVELVVLQGIVPAVAAVADGSKGLYRRSVWLGTRVFQALGVLGGDILRDIFTVGSWLSCGYLWLVSAERWWFDRRIKATIVAWLAPMHQGLRAAYAAFVRRFMPWGMHCVSLAVELAVYRCLFPAATWCRDVADQAVQAAVGVLVQGADLFMRGYASFARSMAKAANVCCQRCVAVSRYMHMAWQLLSVSHRWILHAWAAINGFVHRHQWIVAGLADAYSQARNAVFVPAVRLVIKASRLAWLKILGPFVFSLQTLAVRWAWPRTKSAAERVLRQIGSFVDWGHVQLALSACWIRASAFVVAAYVWMAQSAFVAYMGETVVWLADGMRHRTNALLALMWPMVRRSWTDASQAMCDLYVQLVSAVDFVVAMVGDYIVGYAQSSVVHGRADSGQADGLAK